MSTREGVRKFTSNYNFVQNFTVDRKMGRGVRARVQQGTPRVTVSPMPLLPRGLFT